GASCFSPTYSGPDAAGAAVSGSCHDKAGNAASSTVSFKYDATPPAVQDVPSRPPDANGWYNRPLTISFSGADAVSGVAGCSSASPYGGPDPSAAALRGSRRDDGS